MSTIKAILIGLIMWILGVGVFTMSTLFPILEDATLQSNIVLSLAIIPIAWFGARFLYRGNGIKFHSFQLSSILFLLFILLDAVITVPVFIIPAGGTYTSFFGGYSFWLIGIILFTVIHVYWYLRIKANPQNSLR